jgi:hypothetical protein
LDDFSLRKLRPHLQKTLWFITIRGKVPADAMQNSRGLNANHALEHPEILRELIREKTSPPLPSQSEFDFLS